MSTGDALPSRIADEIHAAIDTLAEHGWVIMDDLFDVAQIKQLKNSALAREAAGEFHPAGIGRQSSLAVRRDIRGDSVFWLDTANAGEQEQEILDMLEQMRQMLNQTCFLGLREGEFHFAHYAPGTGYDKHIDRFRDHDARTITMVLYMNDAWNPVDGGQLRLWMDPEGKHDYVDIAPLSGRMLLFRSEQFWHQVLPARSDRWSLTGWFRR